MRSTRAAPPRCLMQGYPSDDDQRSLTVAGDSVETLQNLVHSLYPTASFTIFMVRDCTERSSSSENRGTDHRQRAGQRRAERPDIRPRCARVRIDRGGIVETSWIAADVRARIPDAAKQIILAEAGR